MSEQRGTIFRGRIGEVSAGGSNPDFFGVPAGCQMTVTNDNEAFDGDQLQTFVGGTEVVVMRAEDYDKAAVRVGDHTMTLTFSTEGLLHPTAEGGYFSPECVEQAAAQMNDALEIAKRARALLAREEENLASYQKEVRRREEEVHNYETAGEEALADQCAEALLDARIMAAVMGHRVRSLREVLKCPA